MSTDQQDPSDAKRVVLDFFDLAFVKRAPAQAAERYLGAGYTQHNPTAADGAAFPPSSMASSHRLRLRRSTSSGPSPRATWSSCTTA